MTTRADIEKQLEAARADISRADTVHLVLEPAAGVTAVEREAHAAEAEWEGEP